MIRVKLHFKAHFTIKYVCLTYILNLKSAYRKKKWLGKYWELKEADSENTENSSKPICNLKTSASSKALKSLTCHPDASLLSKSNNLKHEESPKKNIELNC